MLILRGSDNHGSGDYQASRGDREHNGIDVAAPAHAEVYPQMMGTVTKLGYPYASEGKQHFRYVQITDASGNAHRYFYVAPTVEVGDYINLCTPIGVVQDLTEIYPGMTNHVHYEIKNSDGEFVNPSSWLGMPV